MPAHVSTAKPSLMRIPRLHSHPCAYQSANGMRSPRRISSSASAPASSAIAGMHANQNHLHTDRRQRMKLFKSILVVLFALWASIAFAQNISIATGGTGGVYYPMGGGLAAVLSKYVPGMQATAEVTGGSV